MVYTRFADDKIHENTLFVCIVLWCLYIYIIKIDIHIYIFNLLFLFESFILFFTSFNSAANIFGVYAEF